MTNIVMIGFKSSGKTTVGRLLAKRLGMDFRDLDDTIETILTERYGPEAYTCRRFFREHGGDAFRQVETEALRRHVTDDGVVLASGGGAPMRPENAQAFRQLGVICYVRAAVELIYDRFESNGMPAYLESVPEDQRLATLTTMWTERNRVYESLADVTVTSTAGPAEAVADELELKLNALTITNNR